MKQVDVGKLFSELRGSSEPTELYLVGDDSAPAASALRNAVAHDLSFRKIAESLDLDVELFLHYLVAATARATLPTSSTNHFSAGELEALGSAHVDLTGTAESASEARMRTLTAMALHTSTAISVPDCAAAIGVSPGRLRQRIADDSLYAFRVDNEWRVPAWEVHGRALLPGLDVVVPNIDTSLHPFVVGRFMELPNVDLEAAGVELSPVDWLAGGGDPRAVSELMAGLPGAP